MQELIDAELTSKDRPLDIEKLPSMSLVSGYFGPAHVSDHIYYMAGHLSAHATQGKIIYYY